MTDRYETTEIKVLTCINDVMAKDWDACIGRNNPTICHAFLSAMEDSGSVTAKTGWHPQHLVIYNSGGKLLAATPLYLKSHSYGEYVFDWGWADAYERCGGNYYPKLQSSVPFTPVTGPRMLLHSTSDPLLIQALSKGMIKLCEEIGASSIHITFLPEDDCFKLGECGWLCRTGEQFHWHNDGYETFDDFLGALSSRKRKNIKKERRKVVELDLEIRVLSGNELTETVWDAFYGFYQNTTDRKWGQTYLNRAFFSLITERMSDRIVLMMAYDGDAPVAGALNLIGDNAMFGRNWGCLQDYKFLHFELCYYQAIEYAIINKLDRVEAGAQGLHKLQRGYLPVRTYSAHWVCDSLLRDAIERYLISERRAVDDDIGVLSRHSPFKRI